MGQAAASGGSVSSGKQPDTPPRGARVRAVHPAGFVLFGRVVGADGDRVLVSPDGPVLNEVVLGHEDVLEVFGVGRVQSVGEDESRARAEWEVISMVLAGALEELSPERLMYVSNLINER